MRQLPFLDDGYEHGPIREFWKVHQHAVPVTAGVYILMAAPGVTFMYPRRRSSVFYIGQARNLRHRLLTHLRFALEAKGRRKLALYWPRYEYASAFGARYTFILAQRRESPKDLECDVLACFAERYRTWPVANGLGAWDSLRSPGDLQKTQRSK